MWRLTGVVLGTPLSQTGGTGALVRKKQISQECEGMSCLSQPFQGVWQHVSSDGARQPGEATAHAARAAGSHPWSKGKRGFPAARATNRSQFVWFYLSNSLRYKGISSTRGLSVGLGESSPPSLDDNFSVGTTLPMNFL